MKGMWVFLILAVFSSLVAQDALVLYYAGDEDYSFHFFTGPDGEPAPDGWTLRLVLDGDNDGIDGIDWATLEPLDDDAYATSNNYYEEALNGAETCGTPGTWYSMYYLIIEDFAGSPAEPVINLGDHFYIVLFNAANPAEATHYCTSAIVEATSEAAYVGECGVNEWTDDNWTALEPFDYPPPMNLYLAASYPDPDVYLYWEAPDLNGAAARPSVAYYIVYRSMDNDYFSSIGVTGNTNYLDQGLSANCYWYYVTACYKDGIESEPSNIEEYWYPIDVDDNSDVRSVTRLGANTPNPFNPTTSIAYSMREAGPVTIEIFNVRGQLVKTLVNDVMAAGPHSVIWNGDDDSGASVGSGVYFYKMGTGRYTATKKMILLK